MNKDMYEKALFEMEKSIRVIEDFDKLSADQVKRAVSDAARSMDTFISSVLGPTTILKEYLVIEEEIKAKRMIKEFCRIYFVLRGMGDKEFRKTSRDEVRIFGWKNVDETSKGELLGMLTDIRNMMPRIWKAQN